MGLTADTISQTASLAYADEMVCIMREYYDNVDNAQFLRDLEGKQWVILLKDGARLCGFTTLKLFLHTFQGRQRRIVFSGDTIIKKEYWRSFALPVAWGRLMRSLVCQEPGSELYWLLTSKGYKTYRFLPVFFKSYYPHAGANTQDEGFLRGLIQSLGYEVFGGRFDQERLIIPACPGAQQLKAGIAPISETRRRDKHIHYFERVNPGHARGDELVCIAPFHDDNLIPDILQRIKNG